MTKTTPLKSFLTTLMVSIRRGMRCSCPRCGKGALFSSWYTMRERCDHCDLLYERNPGDTWAFMYVSTAFMTGWFVILMFLFKPENVWIGRLVVWGLAGVVIGGTLPHRKGVAIAIEYFIQGGHRSDSSELEDD